jgi:hypothetical protein
MVVVQVESHADGGASRSPSYRHAAPHRCRQRHASPFQDHGAHATAPWPSLRPSGSLVIARVDLKAACRGHDSLSITSAPGNEGGTMSGRGRSDDPGYVRMVMELRGKLISLADQGPVMPGARRQVAEARERLLAYAGTPLSTFRGTIESAKARTPPIAENPQPGGARHDEDDAVPVGRPRSRAVRRHRGTGSGLEATSPEPAVSVEVGSRRRARRRQSHEAGNSAEGHEGDPAK